MKLTYGLTFVALLLCGVVACDDDDDNESNASKTDREFLQNAGLANLAEVEMGAVAQDSASDSDVRDFGSHMVQEHTTAWNDLKNIADNKKVDLPKEPDRTHKMKLESIMMLRGYQFDTAYVNSQVKDHQMAIALFTAAQANANDDDVRAYAARYLPHLQEHLTNALELQAALADGP